MGSELVVDLRTLPLVTLDDFWDAVSGPCGLPDWFGRNLDAWWDTVEGRGISEIVDAHELVVVRARAAGLFTPGDPDGTRLSALFAEAGHARLDLEADPAP